MKIAICDDEIGTCSDIEEMILRYAKSHALQIDTEVFYSGETLYRAIQGATQFDLVFLDIQLFELNGVQIGKQIREQLGDENISIVYISSKETYAMSLFQVRPLDFLIKPLTEEKVIETLEKFIHLNNVKKNVFYFHVGKSVCQLFFADIRYFACNGKKIEIHTRTGMDEFYGNMQEVMGQIKGKGFWVIHKSYIVNSVYVKVYHYDSVQMTDDTVLPISQKYRKAMKDNLLEICRKGRGGMRGYGLLFALEAVRIWIYMNCFRICIGSYRFPKRVVVIAFSILWIFECSLIATTPLNNKALLSDTIIFCVEVVFCLLVSWCYRGKAILHLLFPVLLPTVYWGGKWVLISSFFQIRTLNSRQYLATTSVMVLVLFLLTGVWGKAWKSKQELEHELLEREVCMYEKQFEVIRQSQHSVRSLKHDMKHHIKMLADMVANGENESALKYLSDMGAFMENSEEYVSTGNERIDSILNYMIGKAKTANVETEWKIQLPEHLDISTFDINIILGNLVENALKALSEVQSPYLNILMKYERGILCISIQNNCMDFQMPDMKDIFISPSANEHGYGLKNVRRVAEKYNGDLTITYENHIFTASVLLFIAE